jgi:hypothetical protein
MDGRHAPGDEGMPCLRPEAGSSVGHNLLRGEADSPVSWPSLKQSCLDRWFYVSLHFPSNEPLVPPSR